MQTYILKALVATFTIAGGFGFTPAATALHHAPSLSASRPGAEGRPYEGPAPSRRRVRQDDGCREEPAAVAIPVRAVVSAPPTPPPPVALPVASCSLPAETRR